MAEQQHPDRPAFPAGHPGFDPDRDIVLDARTIKGLAHPLRVQLLGLLRAYGPSTATGLGQRTGHSSGVTSYHLRQLAELGFVEEDRDRGTGRERWWRARHRATYYDPFELDETARIAGQEFMRTVARTNAERIVSFVDRMPTYAEDMGPGWEQAATLSDSLFWLTADEATRLTGELEEVAARYRRDPEASTEGRSQVYLQFQVLPQPSESSEGEPR